MQPRIFDKANQTLIKTFNCNKLSERANGKLQYQLWQDNDNQSFGIALSENESSGGFSAELIKVDQIIFTLQTLYRVSKPFHAVALKDLFTGKSVNNPSFLGAVLVDQKVIRLHPQTSRLLEVNQEYELWPLSLEDYLQDQSLSTNVSTKRSNKVKTPPQASITTDKEIEDAVPQKVI